MKLGGVSFSVIAEAIESLLTRFDIASVLLSHVEPQDMAAAQQLVKRVQSSDRPVLVVDDWPLCLELKADGVHLSDFAQAKSLRKKLGDGLILGASCPLERHGAMVAAEDGADYVAFAITPDRITAATDVLSWWQEMMTVPTVALCELELMEARSVIALSDFVSPPAALLAAPDPVKAWQDWVGGLD